MEADISVLDQGSPDPQHVAGYAQIALLILRQQGVSDDDIRRHYLTSNEDADSGFEAVQVRDQGRVTAPAMLVKDEMRRLLAN